MKHRTLAVLCLAVALLCGCHAAGGLFTPAEDGTNPEAAPIQTMIGQAAAATGNPLIIAAGALASTILGAVMGRKGAARDTAQAVAAKDREEWTEEDIGSLVAALRARGFKVERAS